MSFLSLNRIKRLVSGMVLTAAVALVALSHGTQRTAAQNANDYLGVGASSWSPDSSRIAFDVTYKYKGDDYIDVYTTGVDGSDPRRLTRLNDFNSAPSYSPDGKSIVFFHNANGSADIWQMSITGGNQTNITNGKFRQNMQPSYAPDGKTILFISNRDGGDFEIYTMGANGKSPKRLTNTSRAWNGDALFSPDGKAIAFTSYRDGKRPSIYTMDADGGNVQRLTSNGARNWSPAWTPDGKSIVFATDVDTNWNVYKMSADGSNATALTTDRSDNGRGGVSVSPDGKHIAFSSDRSGNGFNDLYVMDADGSNAQRLTDLKNQVLLK